MTTILGANYLRGHVSKLAEKSILAWSSSPVSHHIISFTAVAPYIISCYFFHCASHGSQRYGKIKIDSPGMELAVGNQPRFHIATYLRRPGWMCDRRMF